MLRTLHQRSKKLPLLPCMRLRNLSRPKHRQRLRSKPYLKQRHLFPPFLASTRESRKCVSIWVRGWLSKPSRRWKSWRLLHPIRPNWRYCGWESTQRNRPVPSQSPKRRSRSRKLQKSSSRSNSPHQRLPLAKRRRLRCRSHGRRSVLLHQRQSRNRPVQRKKKQSARCCRNLFRIWNRPSATISWKALRPRLSRSLVRQCLNRRKLQSRHPHFARAHSTISFRTWKLRWAVISTRNRLHSHTVRPWRMQQLLQQVRSRPLRPCIHHSVRPASPRQPPHPSLRLRASIPQPVSTWQICLESSKRSSKKKSQLSTKIQRPTTTWVLPSAK